MLKEGAPYLNDGDTCSSTPTQYLDRNVCPLAYGHEIQDLIQLGLKSIEPLIHCVEPLVIVHMCPV